MDRNMEAQPMRTPETKVKQGGPPRVTLWVLLVSIALAALIGIMLLSNTDEFPPSTQRNPVENNPVSGSQPAPPASEPQTRQ
jgi:hypothetical protein